MKILIIQKKWQNDYICDDDQALVLQLYYDNPSIFNIILDNEWFSLFRKHLNNKLINNNKKLTIGFHSGQLCERGTEIALYDYAFYNENIYNNKSIIFYDKNSPNNINSVIKKFNSKFKCYAYDKFIDIDNIIIDENIDYFYNIKYGKKDNSIVANCPNLVHGVFVIEPHGDKYAAISKNLAIKYNNIVDYVPHMINLPTDIKENLRSMLNISLNAIVFGRYGGKGQFDIGFVHSAIKKVLELNDQIYFLFANTNIFYKHPRIIYLNSIINLSEKVKFINTCDAMIHARSDGETFGLAVGEFSTMNKPVITTISGDSSHIDILTDKAIIYNNEDQLINIFQNIEAIRNSKTDWNAYIEYTPEKVMDKFMRVFLDSY